MSLNNIQLQPQLLAQLYNNNLVERGTTTVPDTSPVAILGNNDKKILVLVAHQDLPFLPDTELNFLSSVLAACKLGIADIALVNYNRTAPDALDAFMDRAAKTILLFGIGPADISLPVNFPAFQVQSFNNKTYLHAPSLSDIEKEKAVKMQLWTSLKNLFGI